MKRATAIAIMLVACLASLLCVVTGTQPTAHARALIRAEPVVEQVATVPLYRMYHEATGINFYTANVERRKNAIHNGWKTLGKAGYVFDRKMPNTIPLYMAITDQGAGAIFIYTTNFDEVLKLTQKKGWWTEGNGIVCYVASTQVSGTVPLYRLHRPDIGPIGRSDSFYTTSEAERDSAISQAQYKLVGEEGYVWQSPVTLSSTGGSMGGAAGSNTASSGLPDLVFSFVEYSEGGKSSIPGHHSATMKFCVKNVGTAKAGKFQVRLTTYKGLDESSGLWGAPRYFDFNFGLGPGNEICRGDGLTFENDKPIFLGRGRLLWIDPSNSQGMVKESDEKNNKSWTVSPPKAM